MSERIRVVGGGLAGCECAYQLAERGIPVLLLEQKPRARTPAQTGDGLAELVCSNSFRGAALTNAVGLLKEEMRRLGSLIMAVGDAERVPAGGAMAVDRARFSAEVTRRLEAHPNIERVAEVVDRIPIAPVVIATGPLTGDALAADLSLAIGEDRVAYYDSIAPVVAADSIDWSRVFRASRYGKGEDDAYVNCPLSQEQYAAFVEALLAAEKVTPHGFEDPKYFEGCLPIEVMAERGRQTLAFGPMKPVGLTDPKTGKRPAAVVQLRHEDAAGTAFNLVGFQTRMTHGEQKRVFAMIPGLENARFERFGTIHRNTFVCAPRVLDDRLQLRARPGVYLAGQITGVEGYVESAACGLAVGLMLAAERAGCSVPAPPVTTALGALLAYLRTPREDFQPSNVVWSMFPPLAEATPRGRRGRKARREAHVERALRDLAGWSEALCGRVGGDRTERLRVGLDADREDAPTALLPVAGGDP